MSQAKRIRDLGYGPGYYTPGPKNSILDVSGLKVGQHTIHDASRQIHVGVTVVYPRGLKNTRLKPCYAAIYSLNGAGELTGKHFIDEWGFTNSPIAFTDSMSLGIVYQALAAHGWSVSKALNEDSTTGYAHFGFPVVGETWGGGLTDIHDGASTLTPEHVHAAIQDADTRAHVAEGSAGGGAGMLCQGFKGGTGTSSRVVPGVDAQGEPVPNGGYTVATLVQTNYGQKATLQIGGTPIGKLLLRDQGAAAQTQGSSAPTHGGAKPDARPDGTEGSILVLVVTDAPLLPHQLRRLAVRATFGLAAVGGLGTSHNTSGDIFMAMSTSEGCVPEVLPRKEWIRPAAHEQAYMGGRVGGEKEISVSGGAFRREVETQSVGTVLNATIDALFVAAAEATEEAILNSLCAPGSAEEKIADVTGHVWEGMPVQRVAELIEKWRV